jgi:hypothetical protein
LLAEAAIKDIKAPKTQAYQKASNKTKKLVDQISLNYDRMLNMVVVVYLQEQVQQFGKARRLLRKDQYQ